jgi:hypothetical protein
MSTQLGRLVPVCIFSDMLTIKMFSPKPLKDLAEPLTSIVNPASVCHYFCVIKVVIATAE